MYYLLHIDFPTVSLQVLTIKARNIYNQNRHTYLYIYSHYIKIIILSVISLEYK